MQGFARAVAMNCVGPDRYFLILLSNCGQVEVVPAALCQQTTWEVIFMEPLRHDNDSAFLLVIESGQNSRGKPIIDHPARLVRLRVISLKRVIDDNDVRAASGERPTNRHYETAAVLSRHAFGLGILRKPHCREKGPIPLTCHHSAELACKRSSKLMGVRHAGKSHAWIVAKRPSHKTYRRADRFQRPRRLGDNKSPVLAMMNLHQRMANRIDMPVVKIVVSGRDGREDLGREGAEILAHGSLQDLMIVGFIACFAHLSQSELLVVGVWPAGFRPLLTDIFSSSPNSVDPSELRFDSSKSGSSSEFAATPLNTRLL